MNRIESVIDIGCGDWQFSKFLNLNDVQYIGLDVIPSLIDRNLREFGSERISFSLMPEQMADVPSGDLLIMKDVLQHLSNSTIMDFYNLVFPKFKFCLLTNSFVKLETAKNVDIETGGFRCVDLSAPPYSFAGCYVLEFSSPLWERIRTFLYRA